MGKTVSVVTGGNGFVGSHLVDLLLETGHEVHCIVRKTSNIRWLENKQVKIFRTGLFDKEALKPILKEADYLFHVAGVVKAKTEEGYYKGNVETTKNLLSALVEIESKIKRILIVSSQTASGPSKDGKPVTEEDECHPITRYGKSKLEEEKLARSFMDKLPITIVRPPAVYGERDTEILQLFQTYNKGIMALIGFNKKLVSLIHVSDLVKGIYLAATSEKSKGETYFISSEKFYSWEEVSEVLRKVLGKKAIKLRLPHSLVYFVAAIAEFFSLFSKQAATFNIEKARDFVQQYWICSSQKAMKDLGFACEVQLEEGIQRTIDWYKANNWL